MGKYALIWTTDRGYMPGTNASLNGLEFYNFSPDIDVYIRFFGDYHDLGQDYLNQWPKVSFSNIDGKFAPGRNAYWYLVFDDYHFALNELKDYDVVSFWGGDLCILNDFSYLFEVAHKIDNIVIGTNEHTAVGFGDQMTPKGQPPIHTWSVPFADSPIFVPKSKRDVLQLTMDYQSMPGSTVDRMDGLNYAMRDLDVMPLSLPGIFWIFNVPSWGKLYDDGRHVYFCNQKMYSFHRKYWNVHYLRHYQPGAGEVAQHNYMIFNRKYNFFNTQCRVKWTEGLEVWDGKM